ncbi:MAG: toxin-antitoxin system protein [Clostridia bacterium]|nr:toxin-antitoxin system protein [Clostridia bacterium]
MRPLKEKISITIDSDILETAKNEAEKDDRSLSQYINMVLKQHINQQEKTSRDEWRGVIRK